MKYSVVFSIPVHEKFEVIVDQIININHFNPNCAIVLHLSKKFDYAGTAMPEEQFSQIANGFGNVYINENRLDTVYYNIVHTHVSNYEYIASRADFEYFVLTASNEEFVRPGLYDLISAYPCGFNYEFLQSRVHWMHQEKALHDPVISDICRYFGQDISQVVSAQVEGTFFTKELFGKVIEVLKQVYPVTGAEPAVLYPREEIYYHAIAYFLMEDKTKIFRARMTYVAFNIVGLMPYVWTIRKVMTRSLTDYSVKRVSRKLNDPNRSYIRCQCGNYFDEVHSILPDARRVPVAAIYGYSIFLFLNNWARGLRRRILRKTSPYKDNVNAWSRWR